MDVTRGIFDEFNMRVLDVVMDECREKIYQSPEYQELKDTSDMVYDKLRGDLDAETEAKVENLISEVSWLVGAEMFAMGVAIGRNPGPALTMPESGVDV